MSTSRNLILGGATALVLSTLPVGVAGATADVLLRRRRTARHE
ncbi:hypothetical protein ACWDRR_37990 [Kitasatospora sp. NPDC003701]